MSLVADTSTEITAALNSAGVSADSSNLLRALYSTDASLYRVPPLAVATPRNADEVIAVLEVCRSLGVPLTTRGGGTSIAGNAIGPGVVIDVSRHMNKIISIDRSSRTAVVQPGVIQTQLQAAAAAVGLRFGPDPSTASRCTIGGMIGNNACGSRALAYGRTSDNVQALDVVMGSGLRTTFTHGSSSQGAAGEPGTQEKDRLRRLVNENEALINKEFGRFGRQVSGYAMEQLLPNNNFDIARFLPGTEGTLALTLEATMNLVVDPPQRALVVLGYDSMAEAADVAPSVLPFGPTACEGMDSRIVDAVRVRMGGDRVPPLPRGLGWLFVEVVGESIAEVTAKAIEVANAASPIDSLIVTNPSDAAKLWRIREDGAGLASRTPDGRPAYAGWEDSAVPPEQLGKYLRDFEALMKQHNIMGMPYGHFGDGCVHVRLDYPLTENNGAEHMRAFINDAANLVVKYGGSLSGEHGDGRARGELLSKMYSPAAIALFGQVKDIFDPDGILNPGIIVEARPFTADLRVPAAHKVNKGLAFAYSHDHGDFSESVHKCVGVGKCRADLGEHGVMCPSYQATGNEKDSTRGRARVLQEMVNGTMVKEQWRSKEVHEALDLCLSCKGCATDCPTGVDMASYKAEVLHQSYKHRLRPRAHYVLGWLPRWARLASQAPRVTNLLLNTPGLKHFGRWSAGVDQRRSLPTFARDPFRAWLDDHTPAHPEGPTVALWIDTFTNYFDPQVGIAAVEVLEAAGYNVVTTDKQVCCGLTWISTGQLDTAKRKLRKSVKALKKFTDENIAVVGLEPSCTGTLRSDLAELVDTNQARKAAANVKTLAELLSETDGWKAPDLRGVDVVAQPHCHHSSVMGWSPDAQLLKDSGANVKQLGGCCGLAGNFGVEKGHYDVSVAVAETQLLPAVRAQAEEGIVLADGFSCRTQMDDLVNKQGQHLAQLLANHLND